MNYQTLLPALSAYDQPEVAEGALDPLGLYPISDHLTVNRLCPGVRERQKHPGFLVPIAIGAYIAEEFDGQFSKVNDVSPIQIFEWYVVQSIVQTYRHDDSDRLTGLPGRDKVANAIDQFGCVSTESYLKTPSVFGFYGVYKLLARKLEILFEDKPGYHCQRLINAWEQDEKDLLGNPDDYYKLAKEAIDYGLENGKTQRNWKHWKAFAAPMATRKPGNRVSELIWELLIDEHEPLRSEYIQFLVNDCTDIWQHTESEDAEEAIHKALLPNASAAMRDLLETIGVYEQFARLIHNAFYHILYAASHASKPVGVDKLAELECVITALTNLPAIRSKLEEGLHQHEVFDRFAPFEPLFSTVSSPEDWVNALLDHHVNNQQKKPPNGKMAFFERYDGGLVKTRPNYQQNEIPKQNGQYVHAYRLASLWSFATDLGKV